MTALISLAGGRAGVNPEAGQAVPGVRLVGVSKRYGNLTAVRDVTLDVRAGEFLTLLGPSGSGKTTTLMMLAGFATPSAGEIFVDGRNVTREPAHRRDIGVVFQSYALFPHLNVARNVAFPLEIRKRPRKEINAKVRAALDLVQLGDLAHRYPNELSGGQQQRVALARAIVFQPPLLLMDEPLGALDKKLREHMQIELVKIKSCLNVTVIYVTHDQEEALVMSDRVVVMADGRIQQVGRPEELYQRPANRFVADFIGEANILDGTVTAAGTRLSVSVAGGLEIAAVPNGTWSPGDKVAVVIRPERLALGQQAHGCVNRFAGEIKQVIYLGDASRYQIRLASGARLVAKTPNSLRPSLLAAGDNTMIGWDPEQAWIVDGTESRVVGNRPPQLAAGT